MPASVYLDFAATSAVRPQEVIEAVVEYMREVGATPGRAGHARAVEAGRIAFRCRRALADLFSIPGDPGRIVFQLNATHALNTALFGILHPGDRVVRTRYDHNAVRRPVAALRARGVEEVVLSGDAKGGIDLDEVESALRGDRPPARLLVLPHVSNVLGAALPVGEISRLAKKAGTLVLLDAAQSAGHLPLDVRELGVDMVAFAGHKGLLGPQGTGGLWVREGVEVAPLLHGGTGGDSWPETMPVPYPDHLEAGTQNAPGIAGLLAGVEWVRSRGVEQLHARERALKEHLRSGLAHIRGVTVRSPEAPDGVGIITLTHESLSPAELAARLDREHGVLARAGLHCSPESHVLLGSSGSGALRLSTGWSTTEIEVEHALSALRTLSETAA